MRNAGGYAITTEPGKSDVEEDTFTCCHCNCIVFVKHRCDPAEMGGFCRLCMKHVCKACNAKGECAPFERKLEELEARDRFRRAVSGA